MTGAASQVEESGPPSREIRTLLLCEPLETGGLAGSAHPPLDEAWFESGSAQFQRAFDQLLEEHEGRRVHRDASAFALFERPVQAVAFALAFHREFEALGSELGRELSCRIAVHLGDPPGGGLPAARLGPGGGGSIVLSLWVILRGSGPERFEIGNLNQLVFTDQSSEMDGSLFTATDHNLDITAGPHDYTIKARHRDGSTGSHDPSITNNPT